MDRTETVRHLERVLTHMDDWKSGWGPMAADESLHIPSADVEEVLGELTQRLRDNYPYHHPRYAGQMLKPPHPVAMIAYMAAMQVNPNNHALDGGIATSRMEREVIDQLGQMLGYRQPFLGHLSASGTIANLEALWIARCTHAGKAIAIGDQAHYTHGRACELLNVDVVTLPTDADGRLIVSEVQRALAGGGIGTIVVTAGTTALGMVDPIHEIIPLARAAGVRVHVDAAYGGFFTLLAHRDDPPIHAAPFLAIADADSIVVDPHKHGLQPYGCGAVLFRDPNAGRFYAHDSPYTYFTSADLHLGEITLECSRAGASAAALWATLRCLPLVPDRGLGAVLDKTRQAALAWSGAINAEPRLRLLAQPDLDIIGFFAMPNDTSTPHAGAISRLTQHIFDSTMNDPADPVYLAKLMVTRAQIGDRFPEITWDEPRMEVIRSVLMKPEHLSQVPALHQRVMRAVAEAG